MADHVAPALEAILLVAEEPLSAELLSRLVGAPINDVIELCDSLAAEYAADGRGFILARIAGGYRYQTAPEQAPYVERFVLEKMRVRHLTSTSLAMRSFFLERTARRFPSRHSFNREYPNAKNGHF